MNEERIDANFIKGLQDLKKIDRYQIVKKLGQGGTAVVYLGRDPFINRHVAVKLAKPASDKERMNFFVEAQSAGRLNHPNIVAIYDAGLYNEYCYITMEYISGTTLEACCRKGCLLPLSKVVECVFTICQALDYAHQQHVIHRDIKPSNIMLDDNGTAKITDFGIAQMTEQTSEMGIWGTPSYMAPEQLKDEAIGSFSDIFSLGCVLYEMLTGTQAFGGNNNFAIMYKITNEEPVPAHCLRPDLPPILQGILQKAMAKKIEDRYQSCMELAFDLRVALRGIADKAVAFNGRAKDVIDLVQNVKFFQQFPRQHLETLISSNTLIKVPKDKIIVNEGDIDDTFFIILSGKARILKGNKEIAIIGVGECFGEMAYIAGQARTAAVVASTDCILIKISATIIDRSPETVQLLFFKNFANTLVQRLSDHK
ncbi:MAG: protein kinase [Desulfobacterales bacterium]|nr:protein kinase [Desulfobacterales bacterium]